MMSLNTLKSVKNRIVLVLLLLVWQVACANPSFFKPNSKLTLAENKYLSDELNDFDWTKDWKSELLKKYNILNSMLVNKEKISPEFEIQVIKSKYLLAQSMGDIDRQLSSLELYIDRYKGAGEDRPFELYQAYCTLKQVIEDDNTQATCFVEVEKLMDEFPSDILDEGRGRLFSYQKILVNYFANNRKETDSLCLFIEDYKKGNTSDKDAMGLFIKSSIDGYYSSGILSDEDSRYLKCLTIFL